MSAPIAVLPRRRVVFIIDELEVGGTQRQILLLGKSLRSSCEVLVVYFQEKGAVLREEFEAAGLEVLLVRKRSSIDIAFFARLVKLLRRERDSYCLTFGFTANLWSRLAWLFVRGRRLVACVRNPLYPPALPALFRYPVLGLEKALSLASVRVVANSQHIADSLAARRIVSEKRLLVITNAVEPGSLADRDKAKATLFGMVPDLGAGTDVGTGTDLGKGTDIGKGPVIGTLGRLVAIKDQTTFLRAARLVADRIPSARFVIGGEGPERPKLEALCSELQLDGRVFLPGTLPGRQVVAAFDVAVLTSTSEGMPNFLLEAMAAGVPVVSTRAGVVPDLLEQGALGSLVAVGDAEGVAAAIADTLTRPEEARGKASKAEQKLREWTPERIADRYLSLFSAG